MFKELFKQPFQVIILVLGFVITLGSVFSINDITKLAISTNTEPSYTALLIGLGLILCSIVLHLTKENAFVIILGIFIIILSSIIFVNTDIVFNNFDSKNQKTDLFLLIGSGTVHSCLQYYTPSLIDRNPENRRESNIHVLEGGSLTAIDVISTAYRHGRDIYGKPNIGIPILAMASDTMEIEDFSGDQDKKGKFFEVQIGIDTLKLTFAANSYTAFNKAFEDIGDPLNKMIDSFGKGQCITISNAIKWLWPKCSNTFLDPSYKLYVTNPGSGTRKKIEKELRRIVDLPDDSTCWMRHEGFNLKTLELMGKEGAWIAVGSIIRDKANIDDILNAAGENPIRMLTLVNNHKKPITRALYLYGRLSSRQREIGEINPKTNSQLKGYKINNEICNFLNNLFEELEKNPSLSYEVKELIRKQKTDFLHLDSHDKKLGYILEEMGVDEDKDWIYRYKQTVMK